MGVTVKKTTLPTYTRECYVTPCSLLSEAGVYIVGESVLDLKRSTSLLAGNEHGATKIWSCCLMTKPVPVLWTCSLSPGYLFHVYTTPNSTIVPDHPVKDNECHPRNSEH